MDEDMCEELIQAGKSKYLEAAFPVPKSRRNRRSVTGVIRPVVKVVNRLRTITQVWEPLPLRTFLTTRSRSSPRKPCFQPPLKSSPSPRKKPQPPDHVFTLTHRRSFIKYLDEISSSDSSSNEQNPVSVLDTSPRKVSVFRAIPNVENPTFRVPSEYSSSRPASIASPALRQAIYTLDYLESPREEGKVRAATPKNSPKLIASATGRKVSKFEGLNLGKREDLYLFRKVLPSRIPSRRLRKLSGLKRALQVTSSFEESCSQVASILYPTSEVDAVTIQTKLSSKPHSKQNRNRSSSNSVGKRMHIPPSTPVKVTTVLPSPLMIPEN